MKGANVFYASIPSPTEFRKDVLLSQKSVIDSLKKYEHIKTLQTEKEHMIAELKKMLTALKTIANKMKTRLPAQAMKLPHAPKRVPTKEVVKRKSKMQVLEAELSKIESKLSTLD